MERLKFCGHLFLLLAAVVFYTQDTSADWISVDGTLTVLDDMILSPDTEDPSPVRLEIKEDRNDGIYTTIVNLEARVTCPSNQSQNESSRDEIKTFKDFEVTIRGNSENRYFEYTDEFLGSYRGDTYLWGSFNHFIRTTSGFPMRGLTLRAYPASGEADECQLELSYSFNCDSPIISRENNQGKKTETINFERCESNHSM